MKPKIPSLIPKYKAMINNYSHEDEKYKRGFFGESNLSLIYSTKFLDTTLRMLIGKTDNMKVSLCSHQAILNREFPNHFCRVCNKDLSIDGIGRFNDFLVLRHPNCRKPICLDCAKNNPDSFYIAFRNGLEKFENMKHNERIVLHLIEDLKEVKNEI